MILVSGLSALNMSIFLPSLNVMAQYFDTDYAVMQLAVSGYLATTALLQIVIGPVSDRFGRRPVVLGALAIFLAATLGCLMAQSAGTFLLFRMLQGAVVTGIALSRAIVRDMVPQEEAASMIGYVTMGMALVPMLGPVVGGLLDELFGWHATFVFLLVAGMGVLALVAADQGETVAGEGVGFAEQVRTYPELLTSPRFWGYTLCMAFASGAFFAYLGGASFVAGDIFGLGAAQTGLALGCPALGYAVGNGISGRFSRRAGINRMALVGTAVASAGMGLSLALTLGGINAPLVFFGLCTTLGLGNGMTLPNATAGQLSVRPHLAGTASGLGGAIMIGGGAALSAAAGAMLSTRTGTLPLQALMLGTSLASMLAILLVIRRERRLGLA
ncbi:multidrug efflux pump, Major Facilitator Superfamily protein (MFS) [Oceanicola granulosus HTCC2516]|uniref:Bcr/CflA family efflux transporter n=1 Tax=Oceanicola granulosus (strain ATCC BAA-861 / DSM 15982 / KCTC 12143 / HTCC2516) TaxID=314256 RepID=Q2C9Z6_OCEGH|nr:multidrug efflux pump, Major Facilitator Superfamily protein (MFS) [Oceanicola granulosus HTCC2516]